MPNLQGYDNPINGLRPSSTGTEAFAAAGRRAGAFYNQAAGAIEREGHGLATTVVEGLKVAEDYAYHQEVAHGAVGYAGLLNKLTNAWDDTAKTADPNDPTVAAKFQQEQVEPALEDYRKGFLTERGQNWAEGRIDALRNHMNQRSIADMSTKAGLAAQENSRRVINTMTNLAMRDPSSVDMLLKEGGATLAGIVDSSPNLKGVDATRVKTTLTDKMQEAIVKAGAIGAIQKSSDPEKTAEEWGRKYPEYINGAELKALGSAAKSEVRAQRMEERYQRVEDDRLKREASEQKRGQYEAMIDSDDPAVRAQISPRAIWNDTTLRTPDKEHILGYMRKEWKPERDAQVSARNTSHMLSDLYKAQTPDQVDDILDRAKTAVATESGQAGSISKADYKFVMDEITNARSPDGMRVNRMRSDFFSRMAPAINVNVAGIKDSPAMYEYQQFVNAQIKAHPKDWQDLFNPGSNNYLGRPEVLRQFQKPLQEQIELRTNQILGSPVIPRAPRPAQPEPTAVWSEQNKSWIKWDASSGRWVGVRVKE